MKQSANMALVVWTVGQTSSFFFFLTPYYYSKRSNWSLIKEIVAVLQSVSVKKKGVSLLSAFGAPLLCSSISPSLPSPAPTLHASAQSGRRNEDHEYREVAQDDPHYSEPDGRPPRFQCESEVKPPAALARADCAEAAADEVAMRYLGSRALFFCVNKSLWSSPKINVLADCFPSGQCQWAD